MMAVIATFTRLLPKRIVDKRRSVLLTISATRFAPGTFVFNKCDRRVFCNDRKAASELEKKADNIRNNTISEILTIVSASKTKASRVMGHTITSHSRES